MPDCCTTQKGVEKVRLSLSLKQRRDENTNPTPRGLKTAVQGDSRSVRDSASQDQTSASKRPFTNLYDNTLEAAKRLRLVNTVSLPQEIKRPVSPQLPVRALSVAMVNVEAAPVATLANLGNTCFLNSVLYTLRFAPRFLHNLHHLAWDLASVDHKLGSIRLKSSSLGRGAVGLAANGARSWSSKDLLSLGQSDSGKSKIQIVAERLHETYVSLRAAEVRVSSNSGDSSPEPYAAEAFLSALRDVNSTFEGNRQQDAHELLVCILDIIRETCQALRTRSSRMLLENGDSNGIGKQSSFEPETKTLGRLRKSWKKKKEKERGNATTIENGTPLSGDDVPGWDFVSEDFEGTTVLRTTCFECERVTERKQAMCDICVPVDEEPTDEEPFSAAVSSECLRDQDKYWCETCLRYNEARRSVTYETLPRLLVLQLKRFSGGMEKITKHAPTPLELSCFCESCSRRPRELRPHSYTLWAIIMHLGQALSGGHYMAYVRDGISGSEIKCSKESCEDGNSGGSRFMKNFFNRPRPQSAGCAAKECCALRTQNETRWLACDDDVVKPITQDELDDLLSPEPKIRSAATPYLLFYSKNDSSEVG